MTKEEFGKIQIDSQELSGDWSLFALPNGKPLGRNALYEYQE